MRASILLLAAATIIGCSLRPGGTTITERRSFSSVTQPPDAWPTVEELRLGLSDFNYNYQLFKDVASDGRPRWSGQNPEASPIEIVGEDDEASEVIITLNQENPDFNDLDAVLDHFPPEYRGSVREAAHAVLESAAVDPVRQSLEMDGGKADVERSDGTVQVWIRPLDAGS